MNLKEELFQEISQEHGINLLDSELNDIIDIVCKHKFKDISDQFDEKLELCKCTVENESSYESTVKIATGMGILLCKNILKKELEQP